MGVFYRRFLGRQAMQYILGELRWKQCRYSGDAQTLTVDIQHLSVIYIRSYVRRIELHYIIRD
jgi:hypothetical protein